MVIKVTTTTVPAALELCSVDIERIRRHAQNCRAILRNHRMTEEKQNHILLPLDRILAMWDIASAHLSRGRGMTVKTTTTVTSLELDENDIERIRQHVRRCYETHKAHKMTATACFAFVRPLNDILTAWDEASWTYASKPEDQDDTQAANTAE